MRILIADDVPTVQNGLTVLLEQQPGFEVVDVALDAKGLLAQVEKSCPDVVLLGWELPGLAEANLLPALRRACPDMLVIVLSGRLEARQAALAAGADAFISKVSPPEKLLACITSIGAVPGLSGDIKVFPNRSETHPSGSQNVHEKTENIQSKDRRNQMSETNLQSSKTNKPAIAAVIALSIVALACITAFTVSIVLIIDAIPFQHIFPH